MKTLRASADDGRLAEYFTGTGIKHFTGKGLAAYLISLPPLAEQHRIVTKVDELMALCDRLEAARTKQETARNRLTTASLARLEAPDTDPTTFRNHAAFALDNLIHLTTRTDQINALRQTILSLAVRGKLVAQNSTDEPAWRLLARTSSNPKDHRDVEQEDISEPYGLPTTWTWAALDKLITTGPQNGISPKPTTRSGLAKGHYIDRYDEWHIQAKQLQARRSQNTRRV